jgi:IclR family acetate operon transcriptional repressor
VPPRRLTPAGGVARKEGPFGQGNPNPGAVLPSDREDFEDRAVLGVLLSYHPGAVEFGDLVRELVDAEENPNLTAATVVSPHALRREATEIVNHGYAHEREERAPGLASVAAPVFDAAGDAIAALGVTVPAERDLRELIEPVKLSAVELSRTLRGHAVR